MCKIAIKKHSPNYKPCIRGFTRHYWFNLMFRKKVKGKEENKGSGSSKNKKGTRESSCRSRCDICSQTFVNIGNLNRHKKLHYSYNRIRCSVCLRTYSNLTNFKIHIPRHHPKFGVEVSYNFTAEGAKERPHFMHQL